MHFALTAEQRELAAAVRDLLANECPPAVARAGDVKAVWPKLVELGVFGDTDFGFIEAALVAEEAGRACAPGPLPETFAALAVASDDWVGRVATGDAIVTAAAPYAAHADMADAVLVQDGLQQVGVTPRPSIDPGRPLFAVEAPPATGRAFEVGAVAVAGYLVGLGQAMVDQAVGYAKTREQFGRLIGSFQAVKHRLADAHLAVEFARPVVLAAAWALDHETPMVARDASHAKLRAATAAQTAAKAALQVHGAIGYTEECDLVVWLRRTWSMATAFGDERTHRDRIRTAIALQGGRHRAT